MCDTVCYVIAVNSRVTFSTPVTRTREVTYSVLWATLRPTKIRSTAAAASYSRRRHLGLASPSLVLCPAAKFKLPLATIILKRPPAAGPRASTGVRQQQSWTKVIPAGRRHTSSVLAALPAHLLDLVTSHPGLRRPGTRSTLCDARPSAAPATILAATRNYVITIIVIFISRSSSWPSVAEMTTVMIGVQTATPTNLTTRFTRPCVSRALATTSRRRGTRQRNRRLKEFVNRYTDRHTGRARTSAVTCMQHRATLLDLTNE